MADYKSFECAETDLFCDEDTNGLLCFDNDDLVESFDDLNHQAGEKNVNGNGGSDSEVPFLLLPCPSEDCIGWMVMREKEQLPRHDYLMRLRSGELDLSLRREAIDWMIKACAHHNFGELSLYLAMNYMDRFLSVYTLPEGKAWTVQLIAVSCLSLAAKIEEVYVPNSVDIQAGKPKYLFEGKTIQRMEILVMNFLKWNMKAYTPFNFVEYFLRKMNDDAQFSQGQLINKSIHIILSTIKGIDFLEFKASEIAAATALYVSGEIRAMDVDKTLSGFIVEKDRVVKCLELMQDLISINGTTANAIATSANAINALAAAAAAAVPYSPNGVLDATACLSFKSDERTTPTTPSNSNKRRRLNHQTPPHAAN